MMKIILLLASVLAICLAHKSAQELDPEVYKDYQYPSTKTHFIHDRKQKRTIGPRPHGDYSDKSVARQWNEVLLSSIRRDKARPTTHARNLFHVSVAMWELWRVYHPAAKAEAVLSKEPVIEFNSGEEDSTSVREAAFEEALSYACYTLLAYRFRNAADSTFVKDLLESEMVRLGYDSSVEVDEKSGSPSSVGIRIANEIIEHGKTDGSCEQTDYECLCRNAPDTPGCDQCDEGEAGCRPFYEPKNKYPLNPYWNGPGVVEDPNRWQRLEIGQFIDQAGVAVNGYPPFTGPQWGFITPFALTPKDHLTTAYGTARTAPAEFDGVYFDPGTPPLVGGLDSDEFIGNHSVTALNSAFLDVFDQVMWNQSPSDSELGANNFFAENQCDLTPQKACGNKGINWKTNPTTGKPYAKNDVLRGDYTRVLAEFWADGPQSETPPGHWNTLINAVMDHPAFEYRWAGRGGEIDNNEYCVKAYLTLNAALHDAAIAAWGVKYHYDYVRPVTAIRWMASLGQSTNKSGLAYHPYGLPLIQGHVRVVRPQDVCEANCGDYTETPRAFRPGPDFRLTFQAINQTVIKSWDSLSIFAVGVGWLMGQDWRPYQRPSFVTPPFAGYVSGHSTFSRTAAEMLTYITGDRFFPGGLGRFKAERNNFLVFEEGPSQDVELQWATYGDAADECSLSRIFGGIHPPCDDLPGRRMGRKVAERAWEKIQTIIGQPQGSNHEVQVTFRFDVEERFGSEKGANAWATQLAKQSHEEACKAAGEEAQTGPGEKFEGMRARLLPRLAGESELQRTIEVFGAHPDAGLQLRNNAFQDGAVLAALYKECTASRCEPSPDDPSVKNANAHSNISMPQLTVIVVVASLFCIAICGLFYANSRNEEDDEQV